MNKPTRWPENASRKLLALILLDGPHSHLICSDTGQRYFGPSMTPKLQVGMHGEVQVDVNGMVHLCSLHDYEATCSRASWETMKFYANKMRAANTKLAFFSATPQNEGSAPMRHALVRFSRLLGLDIKWYGT